MKKVKIERVRRDVALATSSLPKLNKGNDHRMESPPYVGAVPSGGSVSVDSISYVREERPPVEEEDE